jgi:hypothetical protein
MRVHTVKAIHRCLKKTNCGTAESEVLVVLMNCRRLGGAKTLTWAGKRIATLFEKRGSSSKEEVLPDTC